MIKVCVVTLIVLLLPAFSFAIEHPVPTWTPVSIKPVTITIVVQDEQGRPVPDAIVDLTGNISYKLGPTGKRDCCVSLGNSNCSITARGKGFNASTTLERPVIDGSVVVFVIEKCADSGGFFTEAN